MIKNNGIDVLLPWSDEEAIAVSAAKDELEAAGCVALVSPPDVMAISDKATTYEILKKVRFTGSGTYNCNIYE